MASTLSSLLGFQMWRGRGLLRKLLALGHILRRATLTLPSRAQVVIWDANLATTIQDALPAGIDTFVLPSRGEKYFLHPRVVLDMIRIASRKSGKLSLGWSELGYFAAVIDRCGARTVVTYTDNSPQFYRLPEYCPDKKFIAIQNGWRTHELLQATVTLAKTPIDCSVLCLSDHDRGLFISVGFKPERVHALGSLKAALAMAAPVIPQRRWAICLLSQWRGVIFTPDSPFKVHGDAVIALRDYLARYAMERGLDACVALATGTAAECAFYEQAGLAVIPRTGGDYLHSYRLVQSSDVVVSLYSSLGRESPSLGTRVLFLDCHLPGDCFAGFPPECSIIHRHQDYPSFAFAMDRLRELTNVEYDALLQKEKVVYFCAVADAGSRLDAFTRQLVPDAG